MSWLLGVVVLLLVLVLGLCLYLVGLFHKFQQAQVLNQQEPAFVKPMSAQLQLTSEKQVALAVQLEGQPELLKAKLGELISRNNQDLVQHFGALREHLLKGLGEFKDGLRKSQQEDFSKLTQSVDTNLEKIGQKVHEKLSEGFKKTNETFGSVLERLAKIDEAQKKIESLSSEVVSLQDVLTDKKSRGIFGEVQLNHILSSVFGENNEKLYRLQCSLSNTKIVDAILFLPEPLGKVCVDSKFPLENYKRMLDKSLAESVRLDAQKEFLKNIKKHIDDIAQKYIIKDETSDQAIMFLPAEAIFLELHAYHDDVIQYAHSKRVWITSPTTFLATLTTLQAVMANIERSKYMNILHQEINKLGEDFKRYEERWDDLSRHIKTVNSDVEKIQITSNKISGRFQKILEVEVEGKESLSVIP